jgi:hypothetical protein
MTSKKMTIEDIAVMMTKGFDSVEKRFEKMATKNDLEDLAVMIKNDVVDKMATKDDLQVVKSDMHEVKKDIREINMKIHDIDEYSRGHSRRIEKLEENVGIL